MRIYILLIISVLFLFSMYGCKEQKQSKYTQRVNFDARLEPQDHILSGAGQSPDTFAEYVKVVGHKNAPSIFMFYIGLHEDPSKWMREQKKEMEKYDWKLIPQIGVSMTRDNGAAYDQYVASGMYDHHIDTMVAILKEWDMPVFLRIGYEFSGSWNGYKPESYKKAFIKVTQKLREARLEKVATVWCYGHDDNNLVDFMTYYPGDEYVDWWGVDLFQPREFSNAESLSFLDKSMEHKKPLIVGESTPRNVGVLDGKKSWDKWFVPYFEILNKYPNFKAFCYINWDWSHFPQWKDWGDGRLEMNEYVSGRYVIEMQDPVFMHGYEGTLQNPMFSK